MKRASAPRSPNLTPAPVALRVETAGRAPDRSGVRAARSPASAQPDDATATFSRARLLLAVLAVLAGATSYRRIRLFIGVHRERLNAVFGAGFRRAPAVNTLRALLHALDPAELEAAFRRHAEQLGGAAAPGRRVVALDGKTLRGSFDHLDDLAAAQVLSAFAGEAALILAHQEVVEGDEVAAARALIERLGLRGVLFTADALHCQKNLRRRGRDRQRAAGAGEGQPAAPA